jgi:hypothetical protein
MTLVYFDYLWIKRTKKMKDEILNKIDELHNSIFIPNVDSRPEESIKVMKQLILIVELRTLINNLNIPDVVGMLPSAKQDAIDISKELDKLDWGDNK